MLQKPTHRRCFLQKTAGLAVTSMAALLQSKPAYAVWPTEHFAGGEFALRFEQEFAGQTIIDSRDINIVLPAVAENGAVVPITISSELEQIEWLSIWVKKNPTPLAAEFELSKQLPLYLTARIKMAESSDVVVIARQGERLLRSQQWVDVMQGGCGTG